MAIIAASATKKKTAPTLGRKMLAADNLSDAITSSRNFTDRGYSPLPNSADHFRFQAYEMNPLLFTLHLARVPPDSESA
jgi:hypothetical protein